MAFYLALKFGLLLAALLPLRVFARLTGGCLAAASYVSPKRKIVARNLAAFSQAAGRESGTPTKVFANYGRYWGELLAAARRPELIETLPILVEGEEHLRSAAERGPVCVLTAHLGNWDLMGFLMARRLPGFTAVVEELKPPCLFRLFKWIREAGGCRVLVSDGQGLRLFRHLKEGGSVGLAVDRIVGDNDQNIPGQRVAALAGGYRRFPSAGMDLARRAGASLVPVFLLRDGDTFLLRIYPALADEIDPVQAFAAVLERAILQFPDQWVVLYALHDAVAGEPANGNAKGAETL